MVKRRTVKIWAVLSFLAIIIFGISAIVLVELSQVDMPNPLSLFQSDDTYYFFDVENETVYVYINKDGSATIEYYITFKNYGDPIDIVDIGLPNIYYNLLTARADVDGTSIPLQNIRPSTYILIGVEIHLGNLAIINQGTLHFSINCPIMVFRDDLNPLTMASLEFKPTWFSSDFSSLIKNLEVNIVFPVGFTDGSAVRYHYFPYSSYALNSTHLIYTWTQNDVSNYELQYSLPYGVSFPNNAVHVVYDSWIFGLYSPIQKMVAISLISIGMIIGFVSLFFIEHHFLKKAKYTYIKPRVKIHCLGIRRGLSVVEAAIVIGVPLNKVAALIIFGLLRKNAIELGMLEPLRIRKRPRIPRGLRKYETKFIEEVLKKARGSEDEFVINRTKLKKLFVFLIKDVNSKMKGHSLEKTEAYYKGIIEKAWKEVRRVGERKFNEKKLSTQFEWILLDDDVDKKS
ncbi:MAG: hypothetical protein ACXQS8_02315, partial [Candidatus Helarchaeales archaeon]